ncbi:Ankyrin repeat domain-containing protein 26 [Myotis davidii]|uniref:Ankyrin repeat domain-containing protein 26 n=1 Tax=Myotis davidii TaxID=225400 RepID=L5MGC4_MYODS|nr:Ankyrin repeat domain-containing protein 26 [Myotis davidii]
MLWREVVGLSRESIGLRSREKRREGKASLKLVGSGVKERFTFRRRLDVLPLGSSASPGGEWLLSLLADGKCLLYPCNNENRTALIKAIRCQEEDWATLLLDHGAGPNAVGIDGNTALHCAASGQNIAIVEELLSHKADMEERHEDDLGPLSLKEPKEKQRANFL